MSKSNFSEEFKRDAVRQITQRGYRLAEVWQRLGVSQHCLQEWKKRFSVRTMCRLLQVHPSGFILG